ncbi:MAG: peptide chain release factor N(5)-glutamine methyltransferase [Jatrophihabitans sp.]
MSLTASARLRAASAELAAAGVHSPRVDAELLLAHLLGCGRSQLLLVDRLDPDRLAAYGELIRRRVAGEPVQHLTGSAPFRRLELQVGPGVFIPRPETELILELAAGALDGARLVLDLCAGSGAIALSVAHEYPATEVLAVERAAPALAWLTRNAEARAAAGDRPIEVVTGDVADPRLLASLAGTVDVVLANPPYVPDRSRNELGPEVGHDPADALFAGPDGLSLMPALLATAARLLRSGGLLLVEHDQSHAEAVPALLRAGGQWREVADHRDLAGRPRFAGALRSDAPAPARVSAARPPARRPS